MPPAQIRRISNLPQRVRPRAPELIALLENQQVALQERLEQLRRHATYVKHKIAYWRAIEVHDEDRVANIARTLAGQILADPQCATGQAIG